MIDKDKSLVNNEKGLFKKIINKIKSLFKKEDKSQLPENEVAQELETINFDNFKSSTQENIQSQTEIQMHQANEAEEKYKEIKERFFEKYNLYKNGEISTKELSASEKIMAVSMLEEELTTNKEKSIKETRELNEIEEKISTTEKRVTVNM